MHTNIKYTSEPNPHKSLADKLRKSYGKEMAAHIYSEHRQNNQNLFFSRLSDYKEMIAYYQGNQSVDRYKKMFDLHRNQDNSWLNIDWRIHNYASKRLNIIIDMLASEGYKARFDPVDFLAIDRKKEVETKLKASLLLKGVREQLGQMTEQSPELGGSNFKSMDEIEMFMDKDYKDQYAIEAEDAVEHYMNINDWPQIQKDAALWLGITNLGCVRTKFSDSGQPDAAFCRPDRLVVPRSEHEDFRDLKKIGYLRDIALSTLKMESKGEFTPGEYVEIYEQKGSSELDIDGIDDTQGGQYGNNKDSKRIRVMDFSYITEVTDRYERRVTENGVAVMFKTSHTKGNSDKYWEEENEHGVKYRTNGNSEIYEDCYEVVVNGTWIVGTERVYNYELQWNQDRDRKNDAKVHLPYHIICPNMVDGKAVSLMEMILPTLDNLQNYQLKINQHVVSAVPKGVYINLDALENANFTHNDKTLDDRELLRLYFERGIVVGRDSDITGLNGNATPIREIENGLARDVGVMINMMQVEMKKLDEILGLPEIMAASTPHPDTGARVSQIVVQQTNHALGHLKGGIRFLFKRTSASFLRLHQELSERKEREDQYMALGKESFDFMRNYSQVHYHDFGFKLEILPDAEEWRGLYNDMRMAMEKGQIDIGDYYYIKNVDNMKKAQKLFEQKVEKNKREAGEQAQQQMEMNKQVQMESAQMANQLETQLMAMKEEEARKTLQLEYQLKMQLLQQEQQSDHMFKMEQMSMNAGIEGSQIKQRGDNDLTRDMYKSMDKIEKSAKEPAK